MKILQLFTAILTMFGFTGMASPPFEIEKLRVGDYQIYTETNGSLFFKYLGTNIS